MKFSEYREKKILESELISCAEVLAAMDCLMHHLNDEDEIACWLTDGVPDSSYWKPFSDTSYEDECKRADYYLGLVRGMTYGDYEACVKIFAVAVKSQCFKSSYQPRSFT